MNDQAAMTGVPAGTETDAWKEMSAQIAAVFFASPVRATLPGEVLFTDSWAVEAPAYRAHVRAVLRSAELEAICFRSLSEAETVQQSEPAYLVLTARLAWLLWLRQNRQAGRVPLDQELHVWSREAAEYRVYVRSVVNAIEQKGYGIVRR